MKEKKSIWMIFFIVFILIIGYFNIVLMNPKGTISIEQRTLILEAIILMLIIVIPVIFITLLFYGKYGFYKKKKIYRPNWSYSKNIEAIIWIIPIIIIMILGIITWKSTHELDPLKKIISDKKIMNIEIISLDWKWLFIYPKQGIATINELVFPKNVPIELKITSNSVMNSFFIQKLGSQIYAMAGMKTQLHLISNESGKYNGISSSFSGSGFSGMKFTAMVTASENDFHQWMKKVKTSHNYINTKEEFNKIEKNSEQNKVEYFSSVKKNLFQETIGKFIGERKK